MSDMPRTTLLLMVRERGAVAPQVPFAGLPRPRHVCRHPQHLCGPWCPLCGPLTFTDKNGVAALPANEMSSVDQALADSSLVASAVVEPRSAVIAVAERRPSLLVVQVWACSAPCRARIADDLTLAHTLAWTDRRTDQVRVAHADPAHRPLDDDVGAVGGPARGAAREDPAATDSVYGHACLAVRGVVVACVVAGCPLTGCAERGGDHVGRDRVHRGRSRSAGRERSVGSVAAWNRPHRDTAMTLSPWRSAFTLLLRARSCARTAPMSTGTSTSSSTSRECASSAMKVSPRAAAATRLCPSTSHHHGLVDHGARRGRGRGRVAPGIHGEAARHARNERIHEALHVGE